LTEHVEAIEQRRKRLTSRQRREHLLDVTARAIIDIGYETVTMDIVKERAGVSRGLLYSHFGSLDDLMFGLYTRECSRLDVLIADLVQNAATFDEKVRAVVRAYYDFEELHGAVLGQLNLCMTNRWFVPSRRDRLDVIFKHWADIIAHEFGLSSQVSELLARAAAGSTEMMVTAWRNSIVPRGIAETLAVEYALSGVSAAIASRGTTMLAG